MDNEALVDQIVRSLSFEVVAVPQNVVQVDSTSKSTPLNVKIRVRKKHDAVLRHGVLSMPKVDTNENSVKEPPFSAPERVRLVSSDQTIMSFNVLMEADFDKVPPKIRKQNKNMVSPDLGIGNEENPLLPENADNCIVSPFFSKRHNDIFGRCKPGGCLDPPYGEDKYSYQPTQQNLSQPVKNESTKLRSSSIFKSNIFKRKKKSSEDDELCKADTKNTTKDDSILSLNENVSFQTSTVYSNSIITYPHPSNSEELSIQAEKPNKKRFSGDDKSKNSVIDEAGSYYILPKKTKNWSNQNDLNKTPQSSIKTEDNDLTNIKLNNDIAEPKNILWTRIELDYDLKDKQLQPDIDKVKNTSKASNSIQIPLPVPLNTIIRDKDEVCDETFNSKPLIENTISHTRNEDHVGIKNDNQTETFAIYDNIAIYKSVQELDTSALNCKKVTDEVSFSKTVLSLPEIGTLNYTSDITNLPCTVENEINTVKEQTYPVVLKNNASQEIEKKRLSEGGERLLINHFNEKQGNISEPKLIQLIQKRQNGESDIDDEILAATNQNIIPVTNSSIDQINNISKSIRENSTQNKSDVFKLSENKKNSVPFNTAQDMHKNKYSEVEKKLSMNSLNEINKNLSEPILRKIQIGETDEDRLSTTNENTISKTKSRMDHINDDKTNSDLYEEMNVKSGPLISTKEKSDSDLSSNFSKLMKKSSMQNASDVLKSSENESNFETVPYDIAPDTQKINYLDDGKRLSINDFNEKQVKISEPTNFQKEQNFENSESYINQDIVVLSNQNSNLITKTNMDHIKNDSKNSELYYRDIKSHPLVSTKEKSILDITTNFSESARNKENFETISYSKEDLHHIWENKTEALKSMADFITKTTMHLGESDVKNIDTPDKIKRITLEKLSQDAESNQEINQDLLKNSFAHPMRKSGDNYMNAIEDSIKKIESKILHNPISVTESKTISLSSSGHFGENTRRVKKEGLIENFETRILTNANIDTIKNPKILGSEDLKNVFIENSKTILTPNEAMKNTKHNLSPKNINGAQLFHSQTSEELSEKLSTLDLESTKLKEPPNFFDEQNILSTKSSTDFQNSIKTQQMNVSDHRDVNYRSYSTTEAAKKTSVTIFNKNEVTTKYLIGYENKENINTQSILKDESLKHRTAVKLNNKDKGEYMLDKTELTSKQIPYLFSDRVEPELTTQYQHIDNADKSFADGNLDPIFSKDISEVLIKASRHSPWKVDIALQSYTDDNNDKVIKSFDSKNVPERRLNDALLVSQCYLGSKSTEIKIPIDQETDLCVQIKSNKSQNLSPTDSNDICITADKLHRKNKCKLDIANEKDFKITAEYKNENKSEPNKYNKAINDDIRDVLNTIYEQELLPLQDIIKGLREEIDMLAAYQTKFKDKVEKLTPKRPRPLRLVHFNKKCACVKRS